MPDWRKPSDYRFPTNFPAYRWAWEFLRRNRHYRSDWQLALTRFLSKEGAFRKAPLVEYDRGDGYVSRTYIHVIDPDDREFFLPVPEREKWFLLHGLLNPATDFPERLAFPLGFGRAVYFRDDMEHRLKPAGLQFPWAYFDITLPLRQQVDAVLEVLRQEQKLRGIKPRRPTHHRRLWPFYLRLLDGELDNRTPSQIADVLQAEVDGFDEKAAWDRLQAARKLTEPLPGGYLSILRSSHAIRKLGR